MKAQSGTDGVPLATLVGKDVKGNDTAQPMAHEANPALKRWVALLKHFDNPLYTSADFVHYLLALQHPNVSCNGKHRL
jgi:hypothetical protein